MAAKKQQVSIEYRLLIKPTYDETIQKEGYLFLLETTKQFTSFAHHIDVKDEIEGKTLLWNLRGLRAPSMNMPSTGTAQFQKVYFDLAKKIRFMLGKKDTRKISTEIKFLKNSIAVSDQQIDFLKIYTNEQEFEEQRLNDTDVPEPKHDVHRKPVTSQPQTKKKK